MKHLVSLLAAVTLAGACPGSIAGTPRIGTRQIHLDFHTSEHLTGIGTRFSKGQFQQALQVAHVDAINVFAKGHHGWSYYPTQVGTRHPHLDFDLLGAEIAACHEIGVLAPIYFTVGWSARDAEQHPDWVCRNPDGSVLTSNPVPADAGPDTPKPAFQWTSLCVNTGYHDRIMAQVEEICRGYDVDGFWFDIYQVGRLCYCAACRAEMRDQGIDVDDPARVEQFHAQVIKRHQRALRALVARYHPGATVFFNGTTSIRRATNFRQRLYANNTMQDLEDLPTTWGGYDKLPLQSKYFLQAGYAVTAMSGKFHTSWGEFGGFKHPNALRYEAAAMIAWGAHCNFGDQLHPDGEMDMATYRNIGQAYRYVERIEDYGIGGMPVARVGLWRCFDEAHDEGTAKMLLEGHVNFDVANVAGDLGGYEVIIVPGRACLTAGDAERLRAYVEAGGHLLVMGPGALNPAGTATVLPIGARYLGPARYDCDYLVVGDRLARGLVRSPFLNYQPALRVQPEPDTEVLATIREPYFSRTYGHYSSHQNTPYRLEDAPHPGILRHGKVLFIAHELDKLYYDHGAYLHRDLFLNALKLFPRHPLVQTELPSTARVSLLHQPRQHRYVVHLLYAPSIKRGRCEVIEDLPPLYRVPVTVALPVQVTRARLVPDGTELPLSREAGKVRVTVPSFTCHCAVVFTYETGATGQPR